MKRAWIAVLMVALAVPATALAQEPQTAWCGGSHGPQGTNFGECVSVERDVNVAGQGSGLTRQKVRVPTKPENPSALVDRSRQIESPGDSGN